jgi:hypothetical protein
MFTRIARPALLVLGFLAVGLAGCAPAPQSAQAPGAPALPANLRPDLYPKWIDAQGQVKWPPNDGCAATPASEVLPTGALIDRFGSEGGSFFSPKGESYPSRAVPYVCGKMVYTVYKVDKPVHVMACKAAPWFDEPGGATQYKTDDPAYKLRAAGAIEVVPGDSGGNAGAASPCKGS